MKGQHLDPKACLDQARSFHGDLCAGIAIGTRMALLGLEALGIDDPHGADRDKLLVFVEVDRCLTDAILSVTGCHPGKRSMKIVDYGKMAATFVNRATGRAVRVAVQSRMRPGEVRTREEIERETPRDPEEFMRMAADVLFSVQEVDVELRPEDLPGRPVQILTCSACGEQIMDKREVVRDGKAWCRPCAEGRAYYQVPSGTARP